MNQSLDIKEDESVVVLNDSNDMELVESVNEVLSDSEIDYEYVEYEEPERQGEEPPPEVAKIMKEKDVFIAPTMKSISNTEARTEACEAGSRGATLPGISRQIWESSLQADYEEVGQICRKVFSQIQGETTIKVSTPSGTDLEMTIDKEYFHMDDGIIREPGDFGNLPAGEVYGGVLEMNGRMVIDHFPITDDDRPVLEISGNRVVGIRNVKRDSKLLKALNDIKDARNIAEFGFGTNPAAGLIGNVLQDEKTLGTVHVALGDNASYFPQGHPRFVSSKIHWDMILKRPTVWFDDEKMLDRGEPTFLGSEFQK